MMSTLPRNVLKFAISSRSVTKLFVANMSKQVSKEPESKRDSLFRSVELEVRGHDKAVLKSYLEFVKSACTHLEIRSTDVKVVPYVRWVQYALRAKFAKKKYKLHYESRTHINSLQIRDVTGSTASTFLEYVQRNIPEGVGMVTYEEVCTLPGAIIDDQRKCVPVVSE